MSTGNHAVNFCSPAAMCRSMLQEMEKYVAK